MVASAANHTHDDQHQPRERWTAEDAHALVRPALQRIAGFIELGEDWDSYGAMPSSSIARVEAQRWVEIVASLFAPRADAHARPYSVAPLADGGVQVEWRGPGGAVELEVGAEGELGYLLTEGQGSTVNYREADDVSWSDVLRLLIRVLTP